MTRQKYVIANWKMNGSAAFNRELLSRLLPVVEQQAAATIAICPAAAYLAQVADELQQSSIVLGAQNLSEHAAGAFTGEVSGPMLKDVGCAFVLVGHSERRALFAERNGTVAAKFAAAQDAGLVPVLCVGETLQERQALMTQAVINEQLQAVIERVGVERLAQAVIAYEPVWAIGTGVTATALQAQEVHGQIRDFLALSSPRAAQSVSILYGGSVRADNAAELFAQSEIDGGLIGGASLDAQSFIAICQAASLTTANLCSQ